jgi:tetratricopeptide (TPR) repeat protein
MHQYTKALKTFEQCISMGPSPPLLTFVNGCATFLPYQLKAEIYKRLNDLESAIDCLSKAYQYKKENTEILYEIGHLLNQHYHEETLVLSNLIRICHGNETIKLYECADILIVEQLYSVADTFLSTLDQDNLDFHFLKGKLYFFTHQFSLATQLFQQVSSLSSRKKQRIESLSYLFVIGTLTKEEDLSTVLHKIKIEDNSSLFQVYQNIIDMQFHADNTYTTLTLFLEFLEKLLKLQAYEQFETYLPLVDQIGSNYALLELGRLYERCGYPSLAQTAYYRSLKEFNVIDMAALDYLANKLFNQ